ncbi:MAG: hypothetical protein ACI87E_001529, partial [Mariniblastus sp.]
NVMSPWLADFILPMQRAILRDLSPAIKHVAAILSS